MEEWRNLLYPLGFLANLLFALRFFLQWMNSEKKSQSHFTLSFWSISLWGSFLMGVHSFIQLQYPVCIVQACNVILCWRNRQLMLFAKNQLMSFSQVCKFLGLVLGGITLAFISVSLLSEGKLEWMRVPDFIELKKVQVSLAWNIVGFLGTFLFASRFWVHWWRSEENASTALNSHFWIISLVGSVLALSYFIHIFDLVNIIGYSAGTIPYIRNLMLMKKSPMTVSDSSR